MMVLVVVLAMVFDFEDKYQMDWMIHIGKKKIKKGSSRKENPQQKIERRAKNARKKV